MNRCPTISAPFAAALDQGREHFNRRVLDAQRRHPRFDTAQLAAFLHGPCNTLVAAVAQVDAAALPALVNHLFDLAIELTEHGLGANDAVQRAWSEVAPACAPLLVRHPDEVLGALSNAVIHLQETGGANVPLWLARMAQLAPQTDSLAQLRSLGQLLAWRAGAAHYRLAALAAAEDLPAALARSACDLADASSWEAFREGVTRDRWHGVDDDAARRGVEFGAFTGFGGEFSAPPQLRAANDGFWVRSGARYFHLIADRFGAVLHGAEVDDFQRAADPVLPPGVGLQGAHLSTGRASIVLDLPPGSIALACNADTLAVTSSYTHAIRLFPLQFFPLQ